MVRAVLYLLASGAIWLAEGFLFSRFLGFSAWQTVLMTLVYLALFSAAATWLLRLYATDSMDELPVWRHLSLAPMLVVILGSFASLPIVLLILAAGKLA